MARRIERLLNLIAALSSRERPWSFGEIIEQVPGYDGDNERSVRRAFERDKDALRNFGIQLETAKLDPLQTMSTTNSGYVIRVAADAVQDPGLDLAERAALNVASAFVWEEEGDGDGIDVGAARPTEVVAALTNAVAETRRVRFAYRSSGGELAEREVEPHRIAQRYGRWYLYGRDLLQNDTRNFRLDRIEGEVRVGGAGGFARPSEVPEEVPVPGRPWLLGVRDPFDVVVAADPRRTWYVEREAGAQASGTAPVDDAQWPTVTFAVREVEAFVGWALGQIEHVVVLDPPEVRDRLLARLDSLGGVVE